MRKRVLAVSFIFLFLLTVGCGGKVSGESPQTVISSTAADVASAQTVQPDTSGKMTSEQDAISLGKVTAARIIDGKSGWVGGVGWIARSDDNGADWKIQYRGDQTVFRIFALNGQKAWSLTGKDQEQSQNQGYDILYTDNGGGSWNETGTVGLNGFMHFNSVGDGFVANLRTSDGGKTWAALPVPSSLAGDAYFFNADIGWAVVHKDSAFEIQKTIDGGKTWETVMSRHLLEDWLTGALIRSAGANDAWVEVNGSCGMCQQAYSLFHTADGGKSWITVLANSNAGGGIAPGFDSYDTKENHNNGASPGPLDVVSPDTAYMGGYTAPRDNANTVGWTTDGGKTWVNGQAEYPGYAGALLAMADETNGWWICTDNAQPSVLYTTSDGGKHWTKAYTFDKP